MSSAECLTCKNVWRLLEQPTCPRCIQQCWSSTANFITPKHDPRTLPAAMPKYRSVVTHDLIANEGQVIEHMALSGGWYTDNNYGTVCCHTSGPLSVIPGSGIEAGDPEPDHGLDSLFVADATSNPHLMAWDEGHFRAGEKAGRFVPLASCKEQGCSNPTVPARDQCVFHVVPPIATPAKP